MRQWKAAGPAPREVEDELWKRFRGAQDTFFGARDAANAEQDAEFAANAEEKEALLVEAEALRAGHRPRRPPSEPFRDIAERWDAAGKVPRDQMKDARGPDAQGRAGDPRRRGRPVAPQRPREVRPRRRHGRPSSRRAIADLEADLEKARAAGDDRRSRTSRRTSPRAGSSSRWPGRPRRLLRLSAATVRASAEAVPPTGANALVGRRGRGRLCPTGVHSRQLAPSASTAWLLGDAVGVEDAVDAADGLEDVAEVLGVGHLEGEPALGDPVAGGRAASRTGCSRAASESTMVMSESSRARSSASTWMLHQERRLRGRRPLDLDAAARAGAAGSAALVQSRAVHRDARRPG